MSATSVRYPDGHVLLRNLNRDMPVIARGNGVHLWDEAGNMYLDGSSGALVVSVGHGNDFVARRIYEQLQRVGYVNGTHFTARATEDLADRLCALAEREIPAARLSRVAFLSSGSEVVEAAVKFVRQLWVERGQPQRTKMIARVPSYHGNTLYALSMSGRPHYKKLYGPMLSEVVTTASPYPYRSGLEDYVRDGAAHYAQLFEDAVIASGPETIAGFIAEPIIGSSAGAAVPPPGYFEAIGAVCKKYGILMIADEILCGTGRSGDFFACKPTGFTPDLVVLGKGLGGGMVALSALMVRDEHLQEMKQGSGYFQHAQTYLQAPMMTAAGLAVLDFFEAEGLLGHVKEMGAMLHQQLAERIAPLPTVGHVQGMGLLAGVELVADKATKAPFPRKRKLVEEVLARAFASGLILWPNVGQANGQDGDLLMIGPPLVIRPPEITELVDKLATTLNEVKP